MLNLIKAELYKISKRPIMYVLVGVLIFSIVFVILGAKGSLNLNIDFNFGGFASNTRVGMLRIVSVSLPFVLIFMMIFGIVFTEDYAIGTAKNMFISKVTRERIFFSKFITQIILAYILATIGLISFIIMLMVLEPGEGYSRKLIIDFIFRFYVVTIPYIGGIAIVNFLSILLKREYLVCIVYYVLIAQVQFIIMIISKVIFDNVEVLGKFLLFGNVGILATSFSSLNDIVISVLVSFIYIVVFTTLALSIYKKQEL